MTVVIAFMQTGFNDDRRWHKPVGTGRRVGWAREVGGRVDGGVVFTEERRGMGLLSSASEGKGEGRSRRHSVRPRSILFLIFVLFLFPFAVPDKQSRGISSQLRLAQRRNGSFPFWTWNPK